MAKEDFPLLRASSALYMNDSKEFEVGATLFAVVLRDVRANSTEHWVRHFCDDALQILNAADGNQAFCACFSQDGDHLGQWRGYGDQAKGCCIAYDYLALMSGIGGVGAWVVYNPANQETIARKLIESLIQTASTIVSIFGGRAAGAIKQQIARDAFDRLLPALCLLFKDSSFREELEFRLIYTDSISSGSHAPRGSRLSGGFFVPYAELRMAGNARLPVKQVRLGPGVKSDKHVRSVQTMLSICNITGMPVETSIIPFLPQ